MTPTIFGSQRGSLNSAKISYRRLVLLLNGLRELDLQESDFSHLLNCSDRICALHYNGNIKSRIKITTVPHLLLTLLFCFLKLRLGSFELFREIALLHYD